MTKEQADLIGRWLSGELVACEAEIMTELAGSEDHIAKVTAAISIRHIGDTKHQIKCRLKVPRQAMTTEIQVFDCQMSLPGMG